MDTTTLLTVQVHCISFALLVAYISSTNATNTNPTTNSTKRNNDMSPVEEPPTKKAKAEVADDWKDHAMNMEEAVMKADEVTFLSDMAKGGVQVLQGIGPKAEAVLEHLGVSQSQTEATAFLPPSIHLSPSRMTLLVQTVKQLDSLQDLADYKFYKVAKAIQVLASTEGKRMPGSTMNIDHALDKEHETKSFKEILTLPLSALEGLTTKADETLAELGVKTIDDLGSWKYAAWAEVRARARFGCVVGYCCTTVSNAHLTLTLYFLHFSQTGDCHVGGL
jgi:predicted flap endonuclease-1-like 5' DNA nuclease